MPRTYLKIALAAKGRNLGILRHKAKNVLNVALLRLRTFFAFFLVCRDFFFFSLQSNSRRWLSVTACLLVLFVPYVAVAADDTEHEYQELKRKIESSERQLREVKGVESVTLHDIDKTNRELASIARELGKARVAVASTQQAIETVRTEVGILGGKLDARRDWLKRKVRAMRRYGQYGDLLLSLEGSDDMTQVLRRWHYLRILAKAERKSIEEFKRDLNALKAKQTELDALSVRLKSDERKVAGAERYLAEKKREKEGVLADTRKKKASYEHMLNEMREAQARLQEVLKKAESSGSYGGKGFAGRKGGLHWPLKGTVAAQFGTANDPRVNTPVFRNGIYIASAEGASVQAVYKGKVVYADWFKGYGQLVIVDHGEGYHTLYGNLSEIFLKTGDIIENKGKVGVVGESGLLNKPSLYFEIRYKGKPLDPSQWLEK